MTSPPTVAVIGGGVAGLAAAHRLRTELGPLAHLVVLEASSRLGGMLRTAELAGHPFDVGAEAFLARRPELPALLDELGIGDLLVHPSRASPAVVAGGRLRPLPRRTLLGVPGAPEALTGLLADEGLARLAAPVPVSWQPGQDSSVADLVGGALGSEVVARSVDPLLGGVYSGSAASLGVRAALPTLAAALDVRAADGPVDLLAAVADLLPATPTAGPVFGAIDGGYRVLLDALLRAATADVRTSTTVTALARRPGGWALTTRDATGEPTRLEADAVVLAVPAPALRRLLADVVPDASAAAGEVELGSSAVVALAYRRSDVTALPSTSGALVATGEHLQAKAFTHSSRKWPHLDAADEVLLRASIGRFGQTEVLGRDDAELIALVRADLADLHGVDAPPVDSLVVRWGGGLPQYAPGHGARVARVEEAIGREPGLAVAGALLHGVGVPATVGTAWAAAGRVAEHLAGGRM